MKKLSVLSLLLSLVLILPLFATTVFAGVDTTLVEFDCSVLPEEIKDEDKDKDAPPAPPAPVVLGGNDYPNVYMADHTIDANVPDGQIYLGGDASTKEAYTQLTLNYTAPAKKAVRLEMDLKIESLMLPNKSAGWRGFVAECNMEGAPSLYFVVHPLAEADADGNNALLAVSQKARANMDVKQNIKIDTTKFQKWVIEYDGESAAKFAIDGKEVLSVTGIAAANSKEGNSLTIKNVMINVGSGKNSIYVDHLKVVDPNGDGTVAPLETPETTAASTETAAPADTAKAIVTVETRAAVLTLPVSDADWNGALTIENAEKPANYDKYGKEASVAYEFDKAAKQLKVDVTFNLNSWLGALALVDADGKTVEFKSDRVWGVAKAGNTLWSHSYTDNGHADAIKTLSFTVDNVTEMPDKYVLFASNTGTSTQFTAKITIDFPAEAAAPTETTAATTAAVTVATTAATTTAATAAATTAATTAATAAEPAAPATFDAAIILAVVMAASAGAVVLGKKKH